MMNPSDIAWSTQMFNQLAEGAMWGVPRSGMIFQRRGNALVLIGKMPHEEGMPISSDELTVQQAAEYESIRQHFEAAGFDVRNDVEKGE